MRRALPFVVCVLIGIAAYFLVRWYNSPKKIEQRSAMSSQQVLTELEKQLKIAAIPRTTNDWDWIGKNGQHIPLTSQMIIIGTAANDGMASYGNIKNNDATAVTKPFIQDLAKKVSDFFLANGFDMNKNNTTGFDEMNTMRLGFTNEKLNCIASFSQQSDPFAYILCGNVNQHQVDLLKEFGDLEDKNTSKNINYIFRVQKVEGDYARGYISNIIGTGWFAKKINGHWKIIIETPDEPLCSDVEKYTIPKTIYESCTN